MLTCTRCHAVIPDLPAYADHGLILCVACPIQEPCAEFGHTYRASQVQGTWLCLLCPATLQSQKITFEAVSNSTPTC